MIDGKPLSRHLAAIERHVELMDASIRGEREHRRRLEPSAAAYRTLRGRVRRLLAEHEGAPPRDAVLALLDSLPRTIEG